MNTGTAVALGVGALAVAALGYVLYTQRAAPAPQPMMTTQVVGPAMPYAPQVQQAVGGVQSVGSGLAGIIQAAPSVVKGFSDIFSTIRDLI